MRRVALTVIVFCLFLMSAIAQPSATDVDPGETQDSSWNSDSETEEQPDIIGDTTLYIHAISLGRDTILNWEKEKAFAYMKHIDSFLQAAKKRQDMAGSATVSTRQISWVERFLSSGILQGMLWVLAAFFVLLIIYRLFLNKGIFVRYAKKEPVVEIPDEASMLAHADFDQLIRQSVESRDFRKAVRYQYLRSLKRLADKGLIQLGAEKTNAAYVQEVGPALKQSFSALVLVYEYVWFGKLDLSADQYNSINTQFNKFNN